MPYSGFESATFGVAAGSFNQPIAWPANKLQRFIRLNPLEPFKDIKLSASENGLGTSVLCIHADKNHKSSANHQHIVH